MPNHSLTGLDKIHTLFQLNIISINPRNHWKCSGISVKKHLTKHVSFCYLKTFLYEKNNFKLCTFLARNYFFGKIKSNYLSFSTLNINLYPGDPRSQKKCLFFKRFKIKIYLKYCQGCAKSEHILWQNDLIYYFYKNIWQNTCSYNSIYITSYNAK